jgi:uncharacterized membrane protein YqjE
MQSTRTEPNDPSAGELVKQVTEQTQRLIRAELALARLEITEKVKHAGIGAGMLAGAALTALFAGGTLVAMLVLVLATAVDGWLAALIVAVGLLAIAGLLAALGRSQLARAVPPAPEEAIENVKADIEEVRTHAHT